MKPKLKDSMRIARDFVRKHPVDDIEDVYLAELMYFIQTGKRIRLRRRQPV